MQAFEYVTADSFGAAAAFLAQKRDGETLVKAGGVDVLDRLKERLDTPKVVLNLKKLYDPAHAVERRDGALAIHALTTLAEVSEHAEVRKQFPALASAARHAATPQIRNVATIGGNLLQKPRCWYYRGQEFHCLKKGGTLCFAAVGDNRYHAIFGAKSCHIVHPSNTAVALRACDASVKIVRHDGGKLAERVVTIDELYRVPDDPQHDEHTLQPGELLREVVVPLAAGGEKSVYMELRERQSSDWPLVSCAANLNDIGKPRVVLGAVAPIPWRLRNVETLIAGKLMTTELAEEAGKLAADGADPMTHNEYKVQQVTEIVSRALRQAAGIA